MKLRLLVGALLTLGLGLCLAVCAQEEEEEDCFARPVHSLQYPESFKAYDTNGDDKADFFLLADPQGRIDRIGYDVAGTGRPDAIIHLDDLPASHCRHLVIILDGFGYDVAKGYYDGGGLRMFHPPSRVIATYPTLTDLCLADALGDMPCPAFQSRYFDPKANSSTGGAAAYLKSANEPYVRLLGYIAEKKIDGLAFLFGEPIFEKDVLGLQAAFDRRDRRELLAYLVSTAAMSTREGADGQKKCLKRVDELVTRMVWQTRGLVKVTLLSDHGHSYTRPTFLDFISLLEDKGWRVVDHLEGPKDVNFVPLGLVTCASFSTFRPGALAADLAGIKGVELASYVAGERVVVISSDGGRATIHKVGSGYIYEPTHGDPLKLRDALAGMKANPDGAYDADELLRVTAYCAYPSPLERLWRAHFALVENPSDVIVSLEDGYCSGLKLFMHVVKIVSTHGSLNRTNSTAFIMSTAGPLSPVMRSTDIPRNMTDLLGTPWPMNKCLGGRQ